MITWEEFKRQVEAEGVKDLDKISFIDVDGYDVGKIQVTAVPDHLVESAEDLGAAWEIT